MKKAMVVFLVIVISVTTLAGCGGTTLSGRYELSSMSSGGMSFDVRELEEFRMDAGKVYIEFTDNKFVMSVAVETLGVNETVQGTYKISGNTLKLTAKGEALTATIDGGNISVEYEGILFVFEKK